MITLRTERVKVAASVENLLESPASSVNDGNSTHSISHFKILTGLPLPENHGKPEPRDEERTGPEAPTAKSYGFVIGT